MHPLLCITHIILEMGCKLHLLSGVKEHTAQVFGGALLGIVVGCVFPQAAPIVQMNA